MGSTNFQLKVLKFYSIPIGFVALMTLLSACSTADFIADGLAYLNCLVTMQHYVPAVYALSFVTPLFYESPEYLSKNDKYGRSLFLIKPSNAS